MDYSFSPSVTKSIAAKAMHRCSNPRCKNRGRYLFTDLPNGKKVAIYEIAHIMSGKLKGPRNDPNFSPELINQEGNGILLCRECHKGVDYEKGIHYTPEVLRSWKVDHEKWVKQFEQPVTQISPNNPKASEIRGNISARGKNATGVHAKGAVKLLPGTSVSAYASENATGILIDPK